MAEERLIDDDKDRKYRIRKNENGEEELVIIDDVEEEEFPLYDVVTDGDDGLTEEQIAEKREERRQNMQRKAEELKVTAVEKMAQGDFESAQYALSQASELTEYDGELYYLQLKACSRNMTDFLNLEKCVEASDGVREYAGEEQKKELNSLSQPLKERIATFEQKCKTLSDKNEAGKAERRATFAHNKKRALIAFAATAVPFAVLAVLAIIFASMIYADKDGLFIILTIAFAACAAVGLFITLFTFTRFSDANRNVKLNERDSSTAVGRELISCIEELENLKKIYSSFSNDIS